MSWSETRKRIEALLIPYEFEKAPEVFNVEKLPSTFIDGVFCVLVEEMGPNADGFGDTYDRFFPSQKIKISVSYDLLNGNQDAYDAAIDKNLKIIQVLINPDNRPDGVRMIGFTSMKTKLLKDQDNFLIVDNNFDLQIQVTFPPTT